MGYFTSRERETSKKCPLCGNNLHICRSCLEVYMHCPVCNENYKLQVYIQQADKAMEEFLENVYIDRI